MTIIKSKPKFKIKNDNSKTFDVQNKPEYKCFSFYDHNPLHLQIFKELGKISKNIYNTTIYSIQVFNYFKIELYKKLYNELINEQKLIKNKKKNKKELIDVPEYIKNKLIYYFDLYSSLKEHLKNNNNYIYKFIINYITSNKIIIKNSNYYITIKNITNLLNNDDLLFNQIIIRIINSMYTKNYMRMKNEMLNHIKFTIEDTEIVEDIKNNNIRDFSTKNIYKPLINELLLSENQLKSDQNYICRLTYLKIGDNKEKLDITMIGSIMTRAFQAYTSYFALLQKGIKAKHPKFLKKDDLYNLIYTYSKAIHYNNSFNVYTSTYLSKNFEQLGNQYIKVHNYKYVDKKYLTDMPNKKSTNKILKKDNYIIDNKYISKDNRHIIDSRYITLPLPKKIKKLEIKTVEIVFINNTIKICMSYETLHEQVEESVKINSDESISIDLGMKNLLAIYNPTGNQNIIDGKFISSTNSYYNSKISIAQSKSDMKLFHKLQLKRKNIINNYFNKIVKWLLNEYSNKKLIILGYNKEWKQGINLGKNNNQKFYSIPYMSLINKIKTKFIENNKIVLLTEESYTSKCDALAKEEICYHEKYLGNRSKRGLFESSTKKLLNADINGAINIMRKIYPKLEEIKGTNICNPIRIKIFCDVIKTNK